MAAFGLSAAVASDFTVFAGTFEDGILRSTDGGDSWKPVNAGFNFKRATAVVPSPEFATDSTVFAGSFGVLFRSEDRGDTWKQVNRERAVSDDRVTGAGSLARFRAGRRAFRWDGHRRRFALDRRG